MNLFEAFHDLNSLNEEDFTTNPEGIDSLADFIDDNIEDDITIDIIDPSMDAEDGDGDNDADDVDSHVGEIVISCDTCKSLIYKQPDEIVADPNSDLVNIDEECPLCQSMNGFELVGKIAPVTSEDDLEEIENQEELSEKEESEEATVIEDEKQDDIIEESLELNEDMEFPKKVGSYSLVVITPENISDFGYTFEEFYEWYGPDAIKAFVYEDSDGEGSGQAAVLKSNGRFDVIGAGRDEENVDGSSAFEAISFGLDESLNEAIPRDMANALRRDSSRSISQHGAMNTPDYANREYTEITPEEAMALRRSGNADDVEMIVNGEAVRFYNDGSPYDNQSGVRNSFGTLAKNASKIYKYSGSDEAAVEKRKQRMAANSLKSYDTDWNGRPSTRELPIDQGSGRHVKPDEWRQSVIRDREQRLADYEEKLNNIESAYESGDISRNEYQKEKERYTKWIENTKTDIKDETSKLPRNKAHEDRYTALEKRMGSSQKRFKDIKRNPAEKTLERRISQVDQEGQNAIKQAQEKRSEIARLQKEIERLESGESNYRQKYAMERVKEAEADLEKEKKDLEALKAGKYVPESFKRGGTLKNHKPLTEDVEDITVETDTDTITVSDNEEGGVDISTEPKEEISGEVIVPLTDVELDAVEAPSEEEVMELESEDELFDEFDEEGFDELGESYLKEVYKNVESFKTTSVGRKDGKLVVEGRIKFESGNQKKTSFLFESVTNGKGKVRLLGENMQISPSKKSFRVNGSLDNKKFVCESLRYRYNEGDNKIFGVCKRG